MNYNQDAGICITYKGTPISTDGIESAIRDLTDMPPKSTSSGNRVVQAKVYGVARAYRVMGKNGVSLWAGHAADETKRSGTRTDKLADIVKKAVDSAATEHEGEETTFEETYSTEGAEDEYDYSGSTPADGEGNLKKGKKDAESKGSEDENEDADGDAENESSGDSGSND